MTPFKQTTPDARPSDNSRASNQDSDQQYIIVPTHRPISQRAPSDPTATHSPTDADLLHQNAHNLPGDKDDDKKPRRSLLHDLTSELGNSLETHQKTTASDFPPRSPELQFPFTATNTSEGPMLLNRTQSHTDPAAGGSRLYYIQHQPRDDQLRVPSPLPAFVTWISLLSGALIVFSCLAFTMHLVCEALYFSLSSRWSERVGDGDGDGADSASRKKSYRPRTKKAKTEEVEDAASQKA